MILFLKYRNYLFLKKTMGVNTSYNFIERLLNSLDTYTKGFDGRKIGAMAVITTAVMIGLLYGVSIVTGKEIFDFNGVLLVAVLLFFGAVYLAIIDGTQFENILTSKNVTTVIEKHGESESYQKKDSYQTNDVLKDGTDPSAEVN